MKPQLLISLIVLGLATLCVSLPLVDPIQVDNSREARLFGYGGAPSHGGYGPPRSYQWGHLGYYGNWGRGHGHHHRGYHKGYGWGHNLRNRGWRFGGYGRWNRRGYGYWGQGRRHGGFGHGHGGRGPHHHHHHGK